MDTITHGIVGALAGKAFFAGHDRTFGRPLNGAVATGSSTTARAAIAACTLGSIFPDIDIFAGPLARNPLAMIEWHRNVTHSLLLLPLWALLLAVVSQPLARWLKWQLPPFAKLATIFAFGLGTHLFLDLVTNFGTMLWSPLGYARAAWDWVFIVDLTLTGMALTPQLIASCYRDPARFAARAATVSAILTAGSIGAYVLASTAGYGFPLWVVGVLIALLAAMMFVPAMNGAGFRWARSSWCRVGFAAVCFYVGLTGVAHHRALSFAQDLATSRGLAAENVGALPLPPTLTHWVAVITTPKEVIRTTFRLPSGAIERTQTYANASLDRYALEAEQLRDVQTYLWFARFPVWIVTQLEGQTVVDITDVRFFRETRAATETTRKRPLSGTRKAGSGFTFEVIFDSQGKIISHGFEE